MYLLFTFRKKTIMLNDGATYNVEISFCNAPLDPGSIGMTRTGIASLGRTGGLKDRLPSSNLPIK
jgi:hypothetical protein